MEFVTKRCGWSLVVLRAGQGHNGGRPSGAEDPCRHTARHNAAHGQARRASPWVHTTSARQPQCELGHQTFWGYQGPCGTPGIVRDEWFQGWVEKQQG